MYRILSKLTQTTILTKLTILGKLTMLTKLQWLYNLKFRIFALKLNYEFKEEKYKILT